VLFSEDGPIHDSFEIARWADVHGTGPALLPEGMKAEIGRWNELSERGLAAGRALLIPRLDASADAKRESLPKFFPKPIRGLMTPLATSAVRFIGRKYDEAAHARAEATLDEVLAKLRAALAERKERTVLPGGLTYADLAMGVLLQLVRPVDNRFIRLGPATREAWTHRAMAERYADLVEWRDELYARSRA
jgi:glutathione S-transferase